MTRGGTDLGGEGGAGAAGDHDRGQQDAHLPKHRDADHVDREDLGTEAAKLIGALEGQHDPDQKGDHADDRQRIEAGALDVKNHRCQPQPRRPDGNANEGLDECAEESEEIGRIPPDVLGRRAEIREPIDE
jgi:hypothetical protein